MSASTPLLTPYKYLLWIWYIFEDQILESTHNLLHTNCPEVELLQLSANISQPASAYPSIRTLSRTFHQWNYCKRHIPKIDSISRQAIQERLWTLFYHLGLSDNEIMLFLQSEGYLISERS